MTGSIGGMEHGGCTAWSRKKLLYRKSQGTLRKKKQNKTSHIDDIVYCVYCGSPACRLISLLNYIYMHVLQYEVVLLLYCLYS